MLTLIAAVAENGCIGKSGALPWRVPEDLAHFKKLTMGKVVIMGRKTWESLPPKFRPLPGRTNVIVTRQGGYPVPDGVEVYDSPNAALARHADDDVFVMGGAELYTQTFARADRLEITHVHRTVDGDAFFPTIDDGVWQEAAREDHEDFSFITYCRSGSTLITTQKDAALLCSDITYAIRGACFAVWKEFGGSFKEQMVEKAVVLELRKRGLHVEQQKRIPVVYDGTTVGTYVPDIIVNESVLVELKCKPVLIIEDIRQFWRYLKATPYRVGLLINFGSKHLDIRRRVYDRARNKNPRQSA